MDNKLKDFINREDCYFIHYASNGFYNGSSPAPKVSCIILYNLKNDKSASKIIHPFISMSLNFAALFLSVNSERAVHNITAALKRTKIVIRILFLMFGFFSFLELTMIELYHV